MHLVEVPEPPPKVVSRRPARRMETTSCKQRARTEYHMTKSVRTQANEEEEGAGDDFANLEDRRGTLFVRVKRIDDKGSVPVAIARAALEAHFGAGQGEKDLAHAYRAHRATINAKVLELAPVGDVYTDANPMLLGAGDFE